MNISLENVTFSHRSKAGSRRVFSNLTLVVRSGECTAVIGNEGTGKTTLLQLMDALLRPDAGKLLIDGKDVWQEAKRLPEIRRQIGFAFQFPEEQFFCETVEEELYFGERNFGMRPDPAHRDAALQLVGLDPGAFLGRSPFALSVGEARRVALANLLVLSPRALLLDEPTVGLDGFGIESVLRMLKHLKSKGVTMVIVSHEVDFIGELADRIIILDNGVAEDAPAQQLLTDADCLALYGYSLPEVASFMKELRQKGYPVDSGILSMEAARDALMKRSGSGAEHE